MKTKNSIIYTLCLGLFLATACSEDGVSPDSGGEGSGAGVGGSMAQYTIINGILYTLDAGKLTAYDIATNSAKPTKVGDKFVGTDAETLFPYRGHLYMGSQNGMSIFDVSKPASPTLLSSYVHITSCDPVVVSGNFAFVTLRQETACRWGQNELHIVDVGNEFNPFLASTYNLLYNPHGLAIRNNTLYICDGSDGLELVDVSDKERPVRIVEYEGFFAYDVIALPEILIVTGKDGIRQYAYEGETALSLVSIIPVQYAN